MFLLKFKSQVACWKAAVPGVKTPSEKPSVAGRQQNPPDSRQGSINGGRKASTPFAQSQHHPSGRASLKEAAQRLISQQPVYEVFKIHLHCDREYIAGCCHSHAGCEDNLLAVTMKNTVIWIPGSRQCERNVYLLVGFSAFEKREEKKKAGFQSQSIWATTTGIGQCATDEEGNLSLSLYLWSHLASLLTMQKAKRMFKTK